jgi:lipopolysaccharide export system permease protein
MLFDSTVRRELAKSFGATLVVILTVVLTMMLIRTLGLAASGAVAPQDVVLMLGYTALGHLPTMLNLSLFVAVVSTLGRMYRDSEMAVWMASGVEISRFIRPVVRMAWPVLLVVAVMALLVWPWGNRKGGELRERYAQRSDIARVAPGQFQASADGKRVFFVERESEDGVSGRNVFILTTQPHGEAVTSARSGRVEVQGEERVLVLELGQRNEEDRRKGETTLARFERYSVRVGDKAPREGNTLPPKARSTLDLMLERGPRELGELTWRCGLILAGANMLLLGIGLSATHPRRLSSWNLLIALLSFVVYFNLINLSQAWVAGGRLQMPTVLLAVHGSLFVLALALLWWRTHATTFGLRRTAAAAAGPVQVGS